MKKFKSNRLLTAGIIMAAAMTATACSKTTTPIDTLPAGVGTSVETSGENLVSTEADKETTKAADKDTTKETSKKADKTTSESKKDSDTTTASDSESTSSTKAEETSTTKAVVTETTTQTTTEESTTESTAQKSTDTQTTQTETTTQTSTTQSETTTQATTEKATEKQPETTTQAPTEAPTTQPETTTQAPTEAPTTQPETTTQAPTEAPTTQPETTTQAPTEAPTPAPTEAPTPAPHVHSYASAVTKTATCAEEGITTYTCSCGDSYTQAIPMTAHSFGDYVYNNDATIDADGTKTATCSVCGATDTVTAEGTKKSLPSWYDEHSQQLNVATGGFDDGSLEAWFTAGAFDWTGISNGCWDFGYSSNFEYIGEYAEGGIGHGWLSKN